MKQKIGVIPAKCRSCRTNFDLRYDLAKRLPANAGIDEIVRAISRLGKHGLLCWSCRKPAILQNTF